MKEQATRANPAQIRQHIERQRRGIRGLEFAHRHPVLDAVAGSLLLAGTFCTAAALIIASGANLL